MKCKINARRTCWWCLAVEREKEFDLLLYVINAIRIWPCTMILIEYAAVVSSPFNFWHVVRWRSSTESIVVVTRGLVALLSTQSTAPDKSRCAALWNESVSLYLAIPNHHLPWLNQVLKTVIFISVYAVLDWSIGISVVCIHMAAECRTLTMLVSYLTAGCLFTGTYAVINGDYLT